MFIGMPISARVIYVFLVLATARCLIAFLKLSGVDSSDHLASLSVVGPLVLFASTLVFIHYLPRYSWFPSLLSVAVIYFTGFSTFGYFVLAALKFIVKVTNVQSIYLFAVWISVILEIAKTLLLFFTFRTEIKNRSSIEPTP